MFKHYTPFEYMLIDIANSFGLDKQIFEDRIAWTKSNIHNLEAFQVNADDPALFCKAVLALRKVQAGKPTGHPVRLDGVCSGIQLMSAMAGCIDGARATGLIDPDTRSDCYTEVTDAMNRLFKEDGLSEVTVKRSDAKDAVMKGVYGSTAVPEELFGDLVDYFYRAANEVAPAAFELMPVLVKSWDKTTMAHEWIMPDGHKVFIPSLVKGETRIRIDELGGASITVEYRENAPLKYSRANCANLIHSVDALVLRNMIRRCSYDEERVKYVSDLLTMHILVPTYSGEVDDELIHLIKLSQESGWVDPVIIDYIHEENLHLIPISLAQKLNKLLNQMMEHPSFDLITVHDAFGCLPTNANRMRYWYKEILAELNESDLINFLPKQLGITAHFEKYGNIADLIRQSNYGLC